MLKTLIVDDNATFRQSLIEHLCEHFPDMVIDEAADSVEGLEKANTLAPDIVIVDIQLPGKSGLQLTKEIKVQRAKVIVAVLTAFDLPEYRDAAHEFGANHFFSKSSSSMEDLVSMIESMSSDLR